MRSMKCRALTKTRSACKRKAITNDGYCRQHAGKHDAAASSITHRLRSEQTAIIARISSGAKPITALGISGFTRKEAKLILSIGAGGEPSITDQDYRDACKDLAQAALIASSKVDAALEARWHKLAYEGDDWRSVAELSRRRNPDEWNVEERIDVNQSIRSDDAVLDALKSLSGNNDASD